MKRGKSPYKQYGIKQHKWRKLREFIKQKKEPLESLQLYSTEEIGRELEEEELKHLYKYILQDRYDMVTGQLKPTEGMTVWCDDLEFGRGVITSLSDNEFMLVKFDRRELQTMCNRRTLTTIHDETKRKIILKD